MADVAPEPVEADEAGRRPYEPPRVRQLGTLADLTRGSTPRTTDGLGPGSSV